MIFQKQDSLYIGKFASLLGEDGILHGISTRKGGVSKTPFHSLNMGYLPEDPDSNVFENRNRFFTTFRLHEDQIVQANQVHNDHIEIVKAPGTYDGSDGFLTNIPNLPLTIRIADCMPVFLYDPLQKVIGLIHAGWRGTSLKILSKAVRLMVSNFFSSSENIKAALGPSIGPCCYQVQEDVANNFPNQYIQDFYLDISQYNYDQLIAAGLLASNIEKNDLCTCCHQEWFFSYRGSRGKTGRMMAYMTLTE